MNQLDKQINDNKGYLKSEGLMRSSRYRIEKLVQSKDAYRVRRGIYVHKDHIPDDEKNLLSEMIPNGIFCLFTAWQQYGFTTTVSPQYHIALHRNTKIITPTYPPVTVYYWSEKFYSLGITGIKVNGKHLNFYDQERSVCDAVRYRNKVGEDVMQEVIKSYVSQKNKKIDRLMQYAKELRVEKTLSPYVKSLL